MMLHRLAGEAGGDIRSCLHALQFASARAREEAGALKPRGGRRGGGGGGGVGAVGPVVDISDALGSALGGGGMKDERSDLSDTVVTVFRMLKKRVTALGAGAGAGDGGRKNKTPRDVERVLRAVEVR